MDRPLTPRDFKERKPPTRVRVVDATGVLSDWLENERLYTGLYKITSPDPVWFGAEVNKEHLEFEK
jgi:hypothetical protein